MEETTRNEGASGMVEHLAEGGGGPDRGYANFDRYLRQGNLTLAMDEAHYAIENAPAYLHTHMLIAQFCWPKTPPESTDKFLLVARPTCSLPTDRAANILNEVPSGPHGLPCAIPDLAAAQGRTWDAVWSSTSIWPTPLPAHRFR
jgi:hypothetical protein